MSVLAEKIRKAREFRVPVEGFTFVVRRPTDLEWYELTGSKARAVLGFIVGWEGVKELDLIPGGDPHPLAFDHEACVEWVTDKPKILLELGNAFIKAYEDHLAKQAGIEKKIDDVAGGATAAGEHPAGPDGS